MRRSEACGRARVGKSSRGSEMMDSGIETANGEHLADRACARRLVDLHGDRFRYLPQENAWIVMKDGVWRRDRHMARMMLLAEDVADLLRAEAAAESSKDRQAHLRTAARRASSTAGQRGMIARASREPGVLLDRSELDPDPWMLCCRNGALDLRSGQLREHRADDFFTRQVAVAFNPDAHSDEWDSFLAESQPNAEVRSFLRRAVGYSLLGITADEAFFLLHGPTATGKSTFLGAVRCALRDYAAFTPFDTFLQRARGNQIRNDVARLAGIRFVAALECNQGDRLDAGNLKAMTGGDVLVARFLRQELFEFKPEFKVWMAANDRPVVPAGDDGIWRRVLEVPFCTQICESRRSGAIKDRLQDINLVGPAILKWALDGCLDWQVRGLAPPEAVLAATREYRSEMARTEGRVDSQPPQDAPHSRNGGALTS